jgi:hypothetical protein
MTLQDWSNLAQACAVTERRALVFITSNSQPPQSQGNSQQLWGLVYVIGALAVVSLYLKSFHGISFFFAERLLPFRYSTLEFARLTWRQRVLERTGLRFREGIPGLCGESHHDEEATSRSQAPRCFQDRERHLELIFLQTTGNQAKQS